MVLGIKADKGAVEQIALARATTIGNIKSNNSRAVLANQHRVASGINNLEPGLIDAALGDGSIDDVAASASAIAVIGNPAVVADRTPQNDRRTQLL